MFFINTLFHNSTHFLKHSADIITINCFRNTKSIFSGPLYPITFDNTYLQLKNLQQFTLGRTGGIFLKGKVIVGLFPFRIKLKIKNSHFEL
jgi:hypothetical protein